MDRRSNSKSSILMGKYEVGRVLGQGTFAKVYRARNIKTGQSVAIKVIDKDKILRGGLIEQIKREISVMRLVPHPNIVQLYEVMASKNKIYFAMEFVKGGELFSKVARGRLKEDAARKYFQQLVAAIEFCHSRGVYHRDLKPENLLLDEKGNLKISDFGLSALWESRKQDSLLHTTCGTPAYVAPEIITQKGYDGAKADVWSCGIVLFVLLAGYLPFNDSNLMRMYKKIRRGEFKCPEWIPVDARRLLARLLDTNPDTRITLARVMDNPWFMKGFKHIDLPTPTPRDRDFCYLSDLHSAFSSTESLSTSSSSSSSDATHHDMRPANYNAFDIISLSPGFDLSGLFLSERNQKLDARFTTKKPASTIVSKFEEIAETERFYINQKDESTVELQDTREGRKGQLVIDAEICEVTPSFFVVELKKTAGDTIEYKNFCDDELKPSLKDIVWTWEQENRVTY